MNYVWLGLILLVVFLDIETSNILLSWFSISFLIAFVLSYMGYALPIQIAAASGTAIPLFFVGNYFSRKYVKKQIEPYKIGTEKLIGQVVRSEESFTDESRQTINGVSWKIYSVEPIEKGEQIKITAVHGAKLEVQKIKKEES